MKPTSFEVITVIVITLLLFVIFTTSEEGEVEYYFKQLELKETISECLDNPIHSVEDCNYIAFHRGRVNHVVLRSCMEFATPKQCLSK